MSPKLRSIFAQVHRKSLLMGSRRDFSSSSAASSGWKFAERDNMDSVKIAFWLGFATSASVVAYKVYKNYYPKLLIGREEQKRMVQRINELRAKAKLDGDIYEL